MPIIGDRSLTPSYLDLPNAQVHLDPKAVDATVRAHSTRFVHFRSMRCVIGVVDEFDGRQPHPDHEGCSNGYLYTRAGIVAALFTGNSKEKRRMSEGLLDSSVGQITVPRTYEDSDNEVLLAVGDRLQIEDPNSVVTHWETVRSSMTGVDSLSRPASQVMDLVDSAGLRFQQDTDFVIQNGKIRWTGRRPTYNSNLALPPLYTVRYTYVPSWYVDHLVHELRNGHINGPDGDQNKRMAQSAMIIREVFHKGSSKADPEATDGEESRQNLQPEGGGLGPR